MKVLREIYDFITGGSIVAPVGLAITIMVVVATRNAGELAQYIFVALIVLTLALAAREKVA